MTGRMRAFLRWCQRRPFQGAFLLNAGIWLLFYAWASPIYLTNDDPGIYFMVSGALKDWPASPYSLFTHVWMGRLWHQLYRLWPHIPWYGGSELLALYVSFSVFLGLLIRRWKEWGLVLYAALFLSGGMWFLLYFHFTMASAFLMTAGLGLWVTGTPRRMQAAGWLLMVWGFLIRPAGVMIAAVIGAAFLWRWLVARRWMHTPRKVIRRRMLAVGGMIGLAWLLQQVHQHHYRHSGWADYLEYNRLRSAIHDYRIDAAGKDSAEKAAFLARLGWSPNDLALFRAHLYGHPTFSLAHLRRIPLRAAWHDKLSLSRAVSMALSMVNGAGWSAFHLSFLWLCALFLWWVHRREAVLAALGWMALWAGTIWLTAWVLKPPPLSVLFPLTFGIGFTAAYSFGGDGRPPLRVRQYIGLIGVVLFVGWHLWWLRNASAAHRSRTRHVVEALRTMKTRPCTYVVMPSFPYAYTPPLHEYFPWDSVNIIPVGGMMQTPLADTLLQRKGLNKNLFMTLLKPDVVLLTSDSLLPMQIRRFFQQHEGWTVEGRVVDSLHLPEPWWRFYMWKFTRSD